MLRSRFALLLPTLLLVAVLLAAGAASARDYPESDRVQRITPEEVLANLIDGTGPIVVDARGTRYYVEGHVPGAWDVNSKDVYGWVPDFEKVEDRGVVFYCADGLNSRRAAGKLLNSGFRKVFVMEGTLKRWQQLGYPIETGPWR